MLPNFRYIYIEHKRRIVAHFASLPQTYSNPCTHQRNTIIPTFIPHSNYLPHTIIPPLESKGTYPENLKRLASSLPNPSRGATFLLR